MFSKPVSADFENYVINPDHTQVMFSVDYLGLGVVRGSFSDFEGIVKYDPSNESLKDIELSIQVRSIDTQNKKRDHHLRRSDFFYVDKFPQIHFELKGPISFQEKKRLTVNGRLSIKDITKDVTITIESLGNKEDTWKKQNIFFKLHAEINREDFGITWN
ncbi:MAG: YceI family protein, partial [Bacteriovoracaceae bacterium]